MMAQVDLVAPILPGRYVGFYRLCGPDGRRFGSRIWADLSSQVIQQLPA